MPIVERGQLEFSCSENFLFRSICVFHCGDGYDIPTNQRRTKVCLASKTWDADDPDCIGKTVVTKEIHYCCDLMLMLSLCNYIYKGAINSFTLVI